ncbi:MAG: restriction endonuclease [Opitutales bacterium]
MAKKTLVDELLDAIQAICFYLPLWAVFLVALLPAVGAFFLVAVVMAPLIKHGGESASAYPLYAFLLAYVVSLAAGLSGWKRRQARKELVARTHSIAELRSLSWRQFEMLVGEFYRQRGYEIRETKGGADGGIDLDGVDSNGRRVLIQCKHWKSAKIGVKVVRETLGVLHKEGAARAFVIGTGEFTKEARAFADGEAIELIDGNQLAGMLDGVEMPSQMPEIFDTGAPAVEVCPRCGGAMVERIARKGPNAGNKFMGCSNFPKCRHTASVN